MITKSLSRKQIIVLISNNNKTKFIEESSNHVTNINRLLQSIKSDIKVNFICLEYLEVIIVTNKVVSPLDFQMIEKYIKNANHIIVDSVEVSCLPQSKSYLKMIGIFYFKENTNTPIIANVIKDILKKNHIFNNTLLVSKLQVIKVFPKSNIAIIWINIWDVQSSNNAKSLINQCFNIGKYITMIRGANMNLGIPQYKNCWK